MKKTIKYLFVGAGLVGATAVGAYALSKKASSSGAVKISSVASKQVGQSVTISAVITNTGNVSATFDAGCSIKDASGATWDCFNGTIMKSPGAGIDITDPLVPGQSQTKAWNFLIPTDMAVGSASIDVTVYKEGFPPEQPPLASTGWLSGLLSITQATYSASIKNVSAS